MMNSPRRMRRQARRIRRGGMQPMMVVTGNDQLPESVARGAAPVRLALPVRTRAAQRRLRCRVCGVVAARRTPALVGTGARRSRHDRLACRGLRRADGPVGPCRTVVRRDHRPRHRRMARVRHGRRPIHHTPAASAHRRRPGAVSALVGAPAPARQGPRRAETRSLARHRQGRGPARFAGHVRRGGRVGLAVPHPAGPRPDHQRSDDQDSRPGIGTGHLPGRHPRLPDPG